MTEIAEFEPYAFEGGLTASTFKDFTVWCARQSVSDIHIQGGNSLVLSHHGRLVRASKFVLADDVLSKMLDDVFTPEIRALVRGGHPVDRALQLDGDVDKRYGLERGERLRLRCNFVQATAGRMDTTTCVTIRIIPTDIPDLALMGIELDLFDAFLPPDGLGLICGITGSGKSTLLAAIYRYCQIHFPNRKVTTIEDPIEFVLGRPTDLLQPTQLQINRDVGSYGEGIRADLRRAPSIIGIGEMRDLETLLASLLAAQVGHFNISTLHSGSPGEAISRCLTMVPAELRDATAQSLLGVLRYIVVQALLKTTDGKRQAVREYIILDDPLREELQAVHYSQWEQRINGIIRSENRRIADQAWRLYLAGRVDRAELLVAMTAFQRNQFEAGNTP